MKPSLRVIFARENVVEKIHKKYIRKILENFEVFFQSRAFSIADFIQNLMPPSGQSLVVTRGQAQSYPLSAYIFYYVVSQSPWWRHFCRTYLLSQRKSDFCSLLGLSGVLYCGGLVRIPGIESVAPLWSCCGARQWRTHDSTTVRAG